MNLFELACATGSEKVAQYLAQELNLVSKRYLKISRGKLIHQMFLYVRVLKKHLASFGVSLQFI